MPEEETEDFTAPFESDAYVTVLRDSYNDLLECQAEAGILLEAVRKELPVHHFPLSPAQQRWNFGCGWGPTLIDAYNRHAGEPA